MNTECLVTIITPCLNSEKTIRNTMESVLYQTYENIEYIIIDGGSTDRTVDLLQKYKQLFRGRMRYVSEADKGIYDAMNKGIRMAHGKIIGIINSDDYYEEDTVETIVAYMSDARYQVVYGYCRLINEGVAKGIVKRCHKDLKQGMIPHPTCFVTRETYKKYGMFLTAFQIAGDYELMLRLYVSGNVQFIQVKRIVASFRMGGKSGDVKKAKREKLWIRCYYQVVSFLKSWRKYIDGRKEYVPYFNMGTWFKV